LRCYFCTRDRLPPNDSWALEGRMAYVLLFGTLWAGGASFFTLLSFLRATTASSLRGRIAGLLLAVALLPLSALLNLPDITPNPVAVLGGNQMRYVGVLYAACMVEYFLGSVVLGAILIRFSRKPCGSAAAIVGPAWFTVSILYAAQLPIALAIGAKLSAR